MLSRNRPIFLKEAIKGLYRWPGIDFELIVFSSGSNEETYKVEKELAKKYKFKLLRSEENEGFRAIPKLLREAKGKYYVWYEDDFLWVEKDWLKKLVTAFENKPHMSKPWHSEWGILSCTSMVDRLTNGAMWKSHFVNAKLLKINGIRYMATQTACGSPFIFDRKKALSMPVMKAKVPKFGGFDAYINVDFVRAKYPVAHVNIRCYHANGAFYRSVYKDTHEDDFIVEAALQLKQGKKDGITFDFTGMQWVLDLLKEGKFEEYIKQLTGGYEE